MNAFLAGELMREYRVENRLDHDRSRPSAPFFSRKRARISGGEILWS